MKLRLLLPVLLLCATSSCNIMTVDSASGPPRIESNGLIDGHVAVGWPAEDRLLHADIFDGTSSNAFFELSVWKLLRVELGFAGAALSVGPLHVGLGVLGYDPIVPATVQFDGTPNEYEVIEEDDDDMEEVLEALEALAEDEVELK